MRYATFGLLSLVSCTSILHGGTLSPVAVPSAETSAPQDKQTVSFHLDNDFFAGVDDNYTNGARFGWTSASSDLDDSFAGKLGTLIGGTNASSSWQHIMGMGNSANLRQQWGLNLSQLMFTPEAKSTLPLYGQHPYVGHLSLGLSSIVKNEDRANVLEFQLGMTGRSSMAQNSQHLIHKLFNMTQWPGWDNQIPGEATFNLYFKRYYRLRALEMQSSRSGFETDALAFWHADVGTVKLQAGGGMTYRFGVNLGNTSSDVSIRGANLDTAPFVYNRASGGGWGYYGYLTAAARVVAHDLYLDGPVFHHYPKYVTKYPLMGEFGYGVGINYKQTQFLFGFHYFTKEFPGQESIQCMGVLQLRVSF